MPVEQSSQPDPHLQLIADRPPPQALQQEEVAAEANRRERERLELDQLRELVRELRQNTEQRRRYATRLFIVMVGWLVVVAYVVLAQGFGAGFYRSGPFNLSDSVMIALITTTTATVIGAFLTVANYLFPKRDVTR
jgi:lipopolysaccharide export LptBFGC system permease protein LptF